MKKIVAILAVAITALGLGGNALALPPFKKEFAKKYLDEHKNADFQKLAKKTGCNVCHVPKAKKHYNNDYGTLLGKLIEGDAQKRIKAAGAKGPDEKKAETEKVMKELAAAFDKVAKEKAPKEDGSDKVLTYGERIKAGLLPVLPDVAVAKHKADMAKKGDKKDVEVK